MHPIFIVTAGVGLAVLTACAAAEPEPPSGRQLFLDNCASCHGMSGKGDGPLAAGLPRPPTDLTGLSTSDATFPTAHVMTHVDGYLRRGRPGEVMPEFSAALDGPTVHVDTGDGILSPAPQPLVALSAYLATLQDG